MSILQIELSDEMQCRLEDRALIEGRAPQLWAQRALEAALQEASPELARKMDEALSSGAPFSPASKTTSSGIALSLRLTELKSGVC